MPNTNVRDIGNQKSAETEKNRAKQFANRVDAISGHLEYNVYADSCEEELLNFVRVDLSVAYLLEFISEKGNEDVSAAEALAFAHILRDAAGRASRVVARSVEEVHAAKGE